MSEWAQEAIVYTHSYNTIIKDKGNHLIPVIDYLNRNISENLKVLDMGCGNARFYLHLKEDYIKDFFYVGMDCNKYLVDIANNIEDENIKAIHVDLDNINVNDLKDYSDYLIYFDSTLGMLKEPQKILNIIKDITNDILLTRCRILDNIEKDRYQEQMWSGMNKPSPNWIISPNTFYNILQRNGFMMDIEKVLHTDNGGLKTVCISFHREKFLFYDYIPILAKHVIDFPKNRYTQWGITPKHNYPPFNINNIKENDIIFVKTDLLPQFFRFLYNKISTKIILLTGVAGVDVNIEYKKYLDEDKIIKWIGCNICFEHPKVVKIPIGFEEPERRRGGPADTGEGGDQILLQDNYTNRKKIDDKEDKLLITYLGNTHNSRNTIIDYFKNKDFVYFADKMNFDYYMKTINRYKFVLSPRGAGTDTHRFWEILLMGSIPVVEKNCLYDLYNKFPCIIVEDFKEVTKELLDNYKLDIEKYNNIDNYLLIKNFNKLIY